MGDYWNEDIVRTSVANQKLDIEDKNIQLSLEKGLNVIEQDIDKGLNNFGDKSFDIVLMSQSFQTLKKPEAKEKTA